MFPMLFLLISCLGVSGSFSSFNYGYDDSFQQLNSQLYSICFRREKSYCSISYKPSSIGNSFSVSTTPNNQISRAGEYSCVSDFLIIPRGTNGGAGANCYVSPILSLRRNNNDKILRAPKQIQMDFRLQPSFKHI